MDQSRTNKELYGRTGSIVLKTANRGGGGGGRKGRERKGRVDRERTRKREEKEIREGETEGKRNSN